MSFRDLLRREFSPYVQLSDQQLDTLHLHHELLLHWNEKLNLTRIRSLDEVVRLHYCESLFLGTLLPPGPLRIADVGSGGGFPGIPVAVMRPDCELILVESHQRKAVFLREAARIVPNIKVISSRVEDLDLTADWLISRAVSPRLVLSLNVAPDVALLLGGSAAPQLLPHRVINVPWGTNRVIAMFHVERDKIVTSGEGHRGNEPKGRSR